MSVPVLVRKERKYIKVTSDFDTTGYMQPRAIIWDDGRTFKIDQVKDFRPAGSGGPIGSAGSSGNCDCYTILIRGEFKHLYFERTDPAFHSLVGRWFVECTR